MRASSEATTRAESRRGGSVAPLGGGLRLEALPQAGTAQQQQSQRDSEMTRYATSRAARSKRNTFAVASARRASPAWRSSGSLDAKAGDERR